MSDPEFLAIYLPLGRVILTFDDKMIDKHATDIPITNPGIVTVGHSPDVPLTLTQKAAERMIENFKSTVPGWHAIPFANSIVRIKDWSVAISRKTRNSGIVPLLEIEFGALDFATRVQNCLMENAQWQGE